MAKRPAKPPRRPRNVAPVATVANPAPLAASAQVDQDLIASGYRKMANRQHGELTRSEREAVRRHEKAIEEKRRWEYYASIPQKHWRQMSGRQAKVINEQAHRYELPFGGPTVNLPALVRAIHDFLAANAVKLARDDDDVLLQGNDAGSPALERYREERAAMARMDRLERERELLPRDQARQAMGRIATILRAAGDTLQRQFGMPALEILYEALDDAQREIDRSFGLTPADDLIAGDTAANSNNDHDDSDPSHPR